MLKLARHDMLGWHLTNLLIYNQFLIMAVSLTTGA
jgi:hypothetical protein